MQPNRIRPLAIGVFRHDSRILVFEGCDPVTQQTFYRPPGGGIEFGEYGHQALAREIREEIGAEIDGVCYLGTLENIFTLNGRPGHEIVRVYAASFVAQAFYERPEFDGREDDGSRFRCLWQPLAAFVTGQARLVPEELLALLGQGAGHVA
ncbi:MAG: hypothetical protein CVU38_16170 [Chloroflexi bacterium HGW-Chloroflexi-1]|nr:MAG: hypothetical protein CVU38_16170 [Chloroflexi bacterium HGW-Chloroflexi-1]